jgi:predicted RNA binding protein YcfA (HicA-like mRNA interferase family)
LQYEPALAGCFGTTSHTRVLKAGWIVARRRASHIVLIKPGVPVNLSIPDHKQLDRGLLRAQIRKAGLTVDEFVTLLEN